MWQTFEQAEAALTRDGYERYTAYRYRKPLGGNRTLWLSLTWEDHGSFLIVDEETVEENDE